MTIQHPRTPAAHRGERFWDDLRSAVGVAVVGAEMPLRLLAIALLAEGHALIEDVPGVGKTLLARTFARALDLSFSRVQGTPDLLPGDVTGSSVYEAGTFRFIPGPIFTNVLLVDEINRATPRTQAAMLEAMQEGQVSADGESRPLPMPFIVMATENPIELEGTFTLPEAELDRFLIRTSIGYPSRDAELAIAQRYQAQAEPLEAVPIVTDAAALLAMRAEVRGLTVASDVLQYLVDLVRASRAHPDLRLGASPRASVALYRASQGAAFLRGRSFVVPEDVASVASSVLAHRLVMDVDRRLRGGSIDDVLADLLRSLPVPLADAS
ncbi:MAG TPA: MoxR family ATPase [Candidatus Saccharimonadales bacterium]|nr:MoxR family ATPase [Candidatus Saccharimonadales bacterium]